MFVLNIIVLIIAALLAAIQAYKEYKSNHRKLGGILILVTLGLVISIVSELIKRDNKLSDAGTRERNQAALLGRADTTLREMRVVLENSNRVLANTGTAVTQLDSLQEYSEQLNDSLARQIQIQIATNNEAKNILQRSERSIELLNRSINEQTGGNSFCYVDVRILPNWDRRANFDAKPRFMEMITIYNDGEYSLRNVHLEVQKPYVASVHLRQNIPIEPWVITPLNEEYVIPRNSKFPIYQGLLPDSLLEKGEIVYDIHFFLGNGKQYTQVVKLAKAHGGWPMATKIIEADDPAYKYEYVHPLYPNKPVNWKYLQPMMNTYRK